MRTIEANDVWDEGCGTKLREGGRGYDDGGWVQARFVQSMLRFVMHGEDFTVLGVSKSLGSFGGVVQQRVEVQSQGPSGY